MPQTVPNSSQLATVSYIDGLNADGTVAGTAYKTWNGDSPATYDTTTSKLAKWYDDAAGNQIASTTTAGTGGGTVTYAFDPASNFTDTQKQAFFASLTLWSDEANITFALASSASTADVLFKLSSASTGSSENQSYSPDAIGSSVIQSALTPGSSGVQASITVDANTPSSTLGSFANGGYSFTALIHEIGHLIGLGHPGAYNDGGGFDAGQSSAYDTRQWSVMSYIDPTDTKAQFYAQYASAKTSYVATSSTTNSNGSITTTSYTVAPQTPMMLDILAAQQLYGTPTNTALSGGQVFGFNSNITDASKSFFDFSVNVYPVVTLWDAGIGNTLDLSGYSSASVVNLNAGSFSSVDGLTNNIGIAYGTAIDTAIGGSGNDVFTVNADSDHIMGGAGTDTVVFSAASTAYTLHRAGMTVTASLTGTSVSYALQSVETLQFTDKTIATTTVPVVPSDFTGDGKSDLLAQSSTGAGAIYTDNGLAITGQTSLGNPGPSWHILGTADFNGDGQADVLFQNDDGHVIDFLMTATGIAQGVDLGNSGSNWHVRGTGDFNSDGNADLLLQSDGGAIVVLETNGTNLIAGAYIGSIPSGWGIEGVADFNGDGQPDILVQSVDGTLVDFTMSGTNFASGDVVGNFGKAYSVAGTGDYNGDGKADIVLHNDNGTNIVMLMNGPNPTSAVFAGNPGANDTNIVTGVDLDGNGTADLVVQDRTTGIIVGYTLDNTASITSGSVLSPPSAGASLIGSNPINFIDGSGMSLVATPGQDQFVMTAATAGAHTITGFDAAQDTLALTIAAFPTFATVQANEVAYNGGTFIGLSPTSAVVIAGVTPDQLNAGNFVLR
jgi:serralysin